VGPPTKFAREPLDPEHGGPARLLVPHSTSGKARSGYAAIELRADDEPGFWEAMATTTMVTVERTAVRRRLTWRHARVVELIDETADVAEQSCRSA